MRKKMNMSKGYVIGPSLKGKLTKKDIEEMFEFLKEDKNDNKDKR